jgi:hypothetical protein
MFVFRPSSFGPPFGSQDDRIGSDLFNCNLHGLNPEGIILSPIDCNKDLFPLVDSTAFYEIPCPLQKF